MNRRVFFGAVTTALAAPAVPRRAYSFLWDIGYYYSARDEYITSDALYLASLPVGVLVQRNGLWIKEGDLIKAADVLTVFYEESIVPGPVFKKDYAEAVFRESL